MESPIVYFSVSVVFLPQQEGDRRRHLFRHCDPPAGSEPAGGLRTDGGNRRWRKQELAPRIRLSVAHPLTSVYPFPIR